jgi:hypothetical protein
MDLRRLRLEYYSEMAAQCQRDPPFGGMLDPEKVRKWPLFYDWLLSHGVNRWQLSARGIGREIEA